MSDSETTKAAIYVVVLDEVLVAEDIGYTITDREPQAVVVHGKSLGDVAERMPTGRVVCLFVQDSLSGALDPAILARAVSDGTTVVLITDTAVEPLPEGWRRLPLPFAREDVIRVLDQISRTLQVS